MIGFVKRLLGEGKPVLLSPAPLVQDEPPSNSPNAPVVATALAEPVVLVRDEIIDTKTRIAGHRFSVHHSDPYRQLEPGSILEALEKNQVATFAERRLALISLQPNDWGTHNYKAIIGPHTVFCLAVGERSQEKAGLNDMAAAIHGAGANIAISGNDMARHREFMLEHADFLLLDFSAYSLASFEQVLKNLRREKPQLRLIVENVNRWPEHRYCLSNDVSYCIGPFTTEHDEEQQAKEISQSRLVLIEMLNQLRKEADLVDIAQIAKRDPGVIVKIVAMANSPMLGLSQHVTSIDQAIMVLGREQLYRWLSIGIFRTGSSSPRDEVLLELALARGRFLEILGQENHSKLECDELFLLGLLSLLDALLGLPMISVVDKIHLSPALKEVLLDSGGPLGRYLMLAIAVEKGHIGNVARLAEQLGYQTASIESASIEAIRWAENAAKLSA